MLPVSSIKVILRLLWCSIKLLTGHYNDWKVEFSQLSDKPLWTLVVELVGGGGWEILYAIHSLICAV